MSELEQRLRDAGFGKVLVARIVRLNPNPELGRRLRGFHLAPTLHSERLVMDVIGKRELIRKFGRQAWEWVWLANDYFRDGRRVYIPSSVVKDRAWERMPRVVYSGKGFNRSALTVE